jgi:hypothetical protein
MGRRLVSYFVGGLGADDADAGGAGSPGAKRIGYMTVTSPFSG